MKIEDLKKIAEAKTKGEWKDWIEYRGARRTNVIALKDDPKTWISSVNVNDSEFISTFANHADALLKVVEAARELDENIMFQKAGDWSCNFYDIDQEYVKKLEKALEELENIK